MRKTYLIPNDGRATYDVANGKVLVTINNVSNPEEATVASWGWTEYIQPAPTPEQLLQDKKDAKAAEINDYDNSDAVNRFYIGGCGLWLNKTDRASLNYSIQVRKAQGRESVDIWDGTTKYTIPITTAEMMLAAVESYATVCFNVTHQHLYNLEQLTSAAEVDSYDYTQNYPSKLQFTL